MLVVIIIIRIRRTEEGYRERAGEWKPDLTPKATHTNKIGLDADLMLGVPR